MKETKPESLKNINRTKLPSNVIQDMVMQEKQDIPESIQSATILMNDEFKRRKTVLNNRQVTILTTLDVISQLYDIPFLKKWISNYAEWRTSGDSGRGRQDITDIFKFSSLHEHDKSKELMGLLRGDR